MDKVRVVLVAARASGGQRQNVYLVEFKYAFEPTTGGTLVLGDVPEWGTSYGRIWAHTYGSMIQGRERAKKGQQFGYMAFIDTAAAGR